MSRREVGRSAEPPPDDLVAPVRGPGWRRSHGCRQEVPGLHPSSAPSASRDRASRPARVAEGRRGCFVEHMNRRQQWWWSWVGVCLLGFLGLGCETYGKADWKARVGHFTWDQAIEELGPPESEAKTSDGSRVADWVISRSRTYSTAVRGPLFWSWSGQDVTTTAESHLLLTFDAQGRLKAWKRIYK